MTIEYRFEYWFNDEDHTIDSLYELIKLENYNNIINIDCSDCNLKELPKLPNSLIELYCNNNYLKELPEIPDSVEYLNCENNLLTVIPKLPTNLEAFYCSNNMLKLLPKLPNSLEEFECSNNQLIIFPKLPPKFQDSIHNIYGNPVYDYIQNKCGGKLKIYHKVNQTFANKIGEWFLECKYNPKYKYCRDRVDKEYNKLF